MPRDILIDPQRTGSGNPNIQFSGSAGNPIRLEVLSEGSVQFTGVSGSLFKISDFPAAGGDLNSLFLSGTTAITGSLLPGATALYDLGSSTKRWANIFATNINGSLTDSGLTAGSVLFAGTGGVITQNNTNLFWNNASSGIGIGTNATVGGNRLTLSGGGIILTDSGQIHLNGNQGAILGASRRLNHGDALLGFNLRGQVGDDNYYTHITHATAGYGGVDVGYQGNIKFWSFSGATTAGAAVTPNGVGLLSTSYHWLSPRATITDFFMNLSGQVGIGTSVIQASSVLHVNRGAGGNLPQIALTNSNVGGTVHWLGTGWIPDGLGSTDTLNLGNNQQKSVSIISANAAVFTVVDDGTKKKAVMPQANSYVGIGTTNPTATLQVLGHTTAGTAAAAIIKEGVALQTGGLPILDVQNSAGTSILFVTGSGRVGIGTIAPQAAFHVVNGSIPNAANLYIGYAGSNNYYDANQHYYRDGSGNTRLTISSGGNVIPGSNATQDLGSSTLRWKNVYATNISGSLTGSNLTAGQVVVAGTGSVLSGSNSFWWDDTNERVGIGTSTSFPYPLTVTKKLGTSVVYIRSNDASGASVLMGDSSSVLGQFYITPGGSWLEYSTFLNFRSGYGGTSRMIIDSSGNVGIDTGTPTARLHINGSTSTATHTFYAKENQASASGTAAMLIQNAAGTNLLFVSGSGRVGIGTAPSATITNAKLEINGSVVPTTHLGASNNIGESTNYWGTSYLNYGYFYNGSVNSVSINGGTFQVYSQTSPTAYSIYADTNNRVGIGAASISGARLLVSGTNTASDTTLLVKEGVFSPIAGAGVFNVQNSSGTSLLFVSGSGNVGIGIPNPTAYKLDVAGQIKSRIQAGNSTGITLGSNGTEKARIQFTASDDSARFRLEVNGVNTPSERLGIYAGPLGNIATNEAMIIGGNGNVGIGTGTLATSRLLITGSGATSSTSTMHLVNSSAASLMFVRDDGNIGIGTTNPGYNLQVGSGASVGTRTLALIDSGYGIVIKGGNGNGIVQSLGTTVPIEFQAGNGNNGNYLFTSTGNVGIGTAIPLVKLHANGSGELLRLVDPVSSNIRVSQGTTNSAGTSYGFIQTYQDNTSTAFGTLALQYSAGSVGIGTINTNGNKLAIFGGNLSIEGAILPSVSNTHSLGSTSYRWETVHARFLTGSLTTLSDGTSYLIAGSNVTITTGSTGAVTISAGLGGTLSGAGTTGYIPKYTTSTTLGNSNIFDNGTNVGIGTSTSLAEKLNINGNVSLTNIVNSAGSIGIIPASSGNVSLNTAGSGVSIISGIFYTTAQSLSITLGTESWIRLATVPNLCDLKLHVKITSTATEENINISIKGNYYNVNTKIDADRVTYAERLREVLVEQPTTNGGPKTIYLKIRTSSFAPNLTWWLYDSIAPATTIHNDDVTATPPTSGISLSLSTAINTQQFSNASLITSGSNNPKVGIGTNLPSAKLHVHAPNGTEIARFSHENSTGLVGFAYSTSAIAGYLGNGSSILTGATSTDFVMRSEGALVLASNGNNRQVTVDTSGNVGIGTATTAAKLFVYTTQNNAASPPSFDFHGSFMRIGDYTNNLTFNNGVGIKFHDGGVVHYSIGQLSGNFYMSQTSDNGNQLFTAGRTDVIIFNSSGQVGIGSTTPSYKLDVNGDVNIASTRIFRVNGTAVVNTQASNGSDIYMNARVVRNESSVNTDGLYLGYGNTGTSTGHIRFFANGTTERMKIAADTGAIIISDLAGNISTSTARLLVSGSATSNIPTAIIREGVSSPASGVPVLDVQNSSGTSLLFVSGSGTVGIGTTGQGARLFVSSSLTGNAASALIIGGQVFGVSLNTFKGQTQLFQLADTTETMRIDSYGNVGIGTNNSNGNKLSVNGQTAVTGSINPGADNTYDLGSSSKRWANIHATNIVSSGSLGPAYTAPTSTVAGTGLDFDGTAIYDTISLSTATSPAALYEITIIANPNSNGDANYRDVIYGKIIVGTGYNGSAVTTYIQFINESPPPRSLYTSGGSHLTTDVIFFQGGTEYTSVPNGGMATIRVKIAGYWSGGPPSTGAHIGSNTTVRLKQIA